MKHTASAIVALALGLGLAAAAQAQGTTQNAPSANNSSTQSAAPAQTMQTPQSAQMQPQIKKQRPAKHAMLHRRGISQRKEIRQVQLRLKSEGLFRGKVTGKMDRQTRLALTKFEKQNRLPRNISLARADRMLSGSSMPQTRTARLGKQQMTRTARLGKAQKTRIAHARMPKSETTGVGSSTPSPSNTPVVNPSSTNPAPSGAGNGSTTPPNNGQSGMNQPNTGGAAKKY